MTGEVSVKNKFTQIKLLEVFQTKFTCNKPAWAFMNNFEILLAHLVWDNVQILYVAS